MYTNAIPLREKLDFQQYQRAVKALLDIGIEIAEPEEDDFYYELSSEEIERLKKSEQQIKEGKTISSEELFQNLRTKYAN
ncbi:toxin-antitoxin system, antitoxin component [Capnocytophaga sp. HP1101]